MFEIFRFYMPTHWSRPLFGTNGAAANVWLMFVLAIGAMLGLLGVLIGGHRSIGGIVALGGAFVVFVALARASLPAARRLYEVDRIIRRRDEQTAANNVPWKKADEEK